MNNSTTDTLWGVFLGSVFSIFITVLIIEAAGGYHNHGVSDMEQRAVDKGVAEYVLIGDSPNRQFVWKSN